MGRFVKVAAISEIPPQSARCVEVEGRRIALVNVEGTIHAIDDTCTHAEASLCEGEVDGMEIVCPLHFATFNVTTGEATGPPAFEGLRIYAVRVEGDDVEIEVD